MKRSGKTNRANPTKLNWIDKFPGCAELFKNAGWLDFFKKIDRYNIEKFPNINYPKSLEV